MLVTGDTVFFRSGPSVAADVVAEVERGVVARLRRCRPEWCELEKEGYRGWVAKRDLWGVEADEVSDE